MTRTIRFRIATIASVAVLAVLVVGGVGLVMLQRVALTASVDQALTQRADDITALVVTDAVPESLPGAGEGFAQVVGSDGSVLAATPNLAGSQALPIEAVDGSVVTTQTVSGLHFDDDSFRVHTRPLPGVGTLHVGVADELVAESTAALAVALMVTIPILVLVLAAVVWWLIGRTLQPVEDIRSGVAEIGSTDLHRRVPQPGTGDEIDGLARTMNEMLRRLESSAKRQQRFVADASHELRSPLTRMRSLLEVGGDGAVTEETVLEEVVDMERTVDDLLYLARADEGHTRIELARIDLDDLVLREAERVRSNSVIDVDLSGVSGAHVVGDRGQLGRAVRNILDNAERHAESRVSLSLVETEGEAILTVTDDGPGIASEDAERIFERFSSLDEARAADTGGAGLGLAIARDIAQRHHGSLVLAQSENSGAEFQLAIPTAD